MTGGTRQTERPARVALAGRDGGPTRLQMHYGVSKYILGCAGSVRTKLVLATHPRAQQGQIVVPSDK